jgi:hypothetical protein
MPYQATVIELFLASPSDVSDERALVREIVAEWNSIHARERQVVLMPVGWETHSSPDLSARPQELINERFLKEADLLVGIFWTRVGSPTGKAISGSVEEIERHLEEQKPVMLYFSEVPVRAGSVDSEQYRQLTEFKTWAMQKGLVEQFESTAEFAQKFRRQLPTTLRDNQYLSRLIQATRAEVLETIDGGPYVAVQPPLSEEALTLLLAAVSDPDDGSIMMLDYMGGSHIQAGKQQFGGENRRENARWRAAVMELRSQGLIEDRGYKGEVFEVTNEGYQVAERLKPVEE